MATEPVKDPASDPAGDPDDELATLRAERDALLQRTTEAEALAEALADQLADAHRRLAEQPATDPHHLTLFDDATPAPHDGHFAADGSDQAVLPIALAATAVVALLVFGLTLVSSGFSVFGFAVLAISGVLAWAAYQTRVVPVSVEIVDGVVGVRKGDDTKRFDLRNDSVTVDVQGGPGDAFWRVRFYRRALDPVDVDDSMVDPAAFMRSLREWRPDL